MNAVTQAKSLIDSSNGDMTVYDVKTEDLEAYNAMIQAYNALSAEKTETLDVFAFDKLLLAVDAKRNFNENGDTAKITEVMNIYNILTPAQKTWFESTDGYVFAEKVINKETDMGIEYTYKTLKKVDLIDFCISMEFRF